MTVCQWIIVTLWIVFIAYWTVSAFNVKRNIGKRAWLKGAGVRLIIIVFLIFAMRNPVLRQMLQDLRQINASNISVGLIGVMLCILGMGLAFSARIHLGRNWGIPMSQKENPELIMTGPYVYVRHPIYGGIILMMLGSVLGMNILWIFPFVLFSAYFIYCARCEENLMLKQFPEQYPSYKKRTKVLLPFIL